MYLFLIRHGQTSFHARGIFSGSTLDPGLNLYGQQQVMQLAERTSEVFPNQHFDAIYTSPFPRAKQTAEILSSRLKIPLFVDDNLKDIDIGDWTGQPVAEILNTDIGKRYFLDPVGVRLPNGEEIGELLDRVIPTIERIRKDSVNGPAIIVTHLDVIKLIVTHYTHRSLHDLHKLDAIPTASGQIISFLEGTVQVRPISAQNLLDHQ